MKLSLGKNTEEEWVKTKAQRNVLLALTDRYLLPDSPLSPQEQAELMRYRQALRDFTKTNTAVDPFPPAPSFVKEIK